MNMRDLRTSVAFRLRRWAGRVRYRTTTGLSPDQERLISEWVESAHPHTTVEQTTDPKNFLADCPPARGAIICGDGEQEVFSEMRSVLFDWAYISVMFGRDLPPLPGDPVTR